MSKYNTNVCEIIFKFSKLFSLIHDRIIPISTRYLTDIIIPLAQLFLYLVIIT